MNQVETMWDYSDIPYEGDCGKHGSFQGRIATSRGRRVHSRCPTCETEERAEQDRKMRERNALSLARQHIDYSGVPERFRGVPLPERAPSEILAWYEALKSGSSTGPLVICGDVGTGKTHLACGLLTKVSFDLPRMRPLNYTSGGIYARSVRDTWNRNSDSSESEILKARAAGFLVLDEIAAGRDADQQLISDLICARYDAGTLRSTVVISNTAAAKLKDAVGDRAADRLKEGATLLNMTGESRRKMDSKVVFVPDWPRRVPGEMYADEY